LRHPLTPWGVHFGYKFCFAFFSPYGQNAGLMEKQAQKFDNNKVTNVSVWKILLCITMFMLRQSSLHIALFVTFFLFLTGFFSIYISLMAGAMAVAIAMVYFFCRTTGVIYLLLFLSLLLNGALFTMCYHSGFSLSESMSVLWKTALNFPWAFESFMKEKDTLNVEHFLDLVSLITVICLWFLYAGSNWRNSLPKYLSVDFEYDKHKEGKKKIRMICRYAPLTGEGDIRAMAQSIGKEMTGSQHLPLIPMVEDKKEENKKSEHRTVMIDGNKTINNGQPFMHYAVTLGKAPFVLVSFLNWRCTASIVFVV
jgi:hypothetical protein